MEQLLNRGSRNPPIARTAIRQVFVAVVEAIKRTVGIAAAVVLGRWLFGEPITRRRLAAVTVMAAGTVAVLQPWTLR